MVIRSDKMNVTTLLYEHQYIELAENILSDSNYYIGLPRDISNSVQTKSNQLITSLERRSMISGDDAKHYRNYNSVVNKFYGLPKVHKPQLSLRPIISGS